MHIIDEEGTKFYASTNKEGKISKDLEVFYNPIMKFNRNISILLLNSFEKKIFN